MSILLLLVFFLVCIAFGFVFLNRVNKIGSPILLIPFSVLFGICSYVFVCHLLSFFIGPKKSSIYTLIVLGVLSLLIFLFARRSEITSPLQEISKKQLIFVLILSLVISLGTFLSVYRFGIFDKEWHIPLAMSIYHNDVYPPRDFFRPEYPIAYHFGGALLAGAIHNITRIDIENCFEIISGVSSSVTFFSFFILAWILSNNFQLSLIAGFCSFFGAGFTWLEGIWGIHGTITDAPSIVSFTATASIGYPLLIFCLVLFYIIEKKEGLKSCIRELITLLISLITLSFFAPWLSLTFLVSIGFYLFIFLLLKREKYFSGSLKIIILFLSFFILNKIIGNQTYSSDHFLGRANIFNIGVKEHPFTITAWSGLEAGEELTKIISCFSWQFLSAFGLSFILFPIIPIYLNKCKNRFALLLFLCAALTMPIPTLFDFKLNPVDFNRLFGFGNTMLILLITCGLGFLYTRFLKNKVLVLTYVILFCLSPFSGFLVGTLFSPKLYLDNKYTEVALNKLKNIHSLRDFFNELVEINNDSLAAKNTFESKYKKETLFFSGNTKPKDVAISSIPAIPVYSGVYTLVPSMSWGLKGQLYSGFDNIYPTILSTLDPHLLSELNVKWIAYDEFSKEKLPLETKTFLNNNKIFMLVYKNYIMPGQDKEILYEVYHVEELTNYLKSIPRMTGWILVNKDGFPVEITQRLYPNISLFSNETDALQYLKQLHKQHRNLKDLLITAQPILIETTKQQLAENGLKIMLEERI